MDGDNVQNGMVFLRMVSVSFLLEENKPRCCSPVCGASRLLYRGSSGHNRSLHCTASQKCTMHWLERAPRTFQPTKTFSFRHSSLMSKPTGRGNVRPSLVSIIQTQGGQAAHPSIENPYGFPLPVAGSIIISEEVVKEGHLVKNLKRRLFTLSIDSDNFPCLSYSCVSLRARRFAATH